MEGAAIQDVLTASEGLDADFSGEMKLKLKRIVSILSRMVMKTNAVSESPARYDAAVEHEHEWRVEPEPTGASEPGMRPSSNGPPTPPSMRPH